MSNDVIVVGCGPAGIFSALELCKSNSLSVLLLDMGPAIEKRRCPASRGLGCVSCDPCSLLSGWGGAGAFSDGKLTLSTEVGGWLNEYLPREEIAKIIDYVDQTYLEFGAPDRLYGTDMDRVEEISRKASLAGLELVPEKLRHLGTDKCSIVLRKMKDELQ